MTAQSIREAGVTNMEPKLNSTGARQLALLLALICTAAASTGCAGFGATGLDRADVATNSTNDTEKSAAPTVKGSLGMTFVLIPSGSFWMGSPFEERRREMDEVQHEVQITRDFYMCQTEVTRGQFEKFVKETRYRTEAERGGDPITWRTPGIDQQPDHPVVHVSWHDAQAFCKWLSKKDGRAYRLPTEAEWEFTARAGFRGSFGETSIISATEANFNGTTRYGKGSTVGVYRASTIAVGHFAPNAWGVYDLHGNVWEWCNDWYGYYRSGPLMDPQGPTTGTVKIARGGSWANAPEYCRVAYRFGGNPASTFSTVGFRLALDVSNKTQPSPQTAATGKD
ncbi:MAG: formylglycine-generating enzyme family protein [Anaerolineae bacterium]|nr:formylglycine-generating enzyme family protein [Phycisphaerae bacterium]